MHWRKSTWALILWTALMALWEGYLGSILNCAYADQVCHAKETGNYTVVFFLWIFGAVPVAIFWYSSRPNKPRPCPACAMSVPAGLLRCQRCGFDFAAAAAGRVVPVYSACWQCQAPVLQGQPACGSCGAPFVWQTQQPSALGHGSARFETETVAGLGRRLASAIIDGAFLFGTAVAAVVVMDQVGYHQVGNQMVYSPAASAVQALWYLFLAAYHPVCWWSLQGTAGQRVLGLRVVRVSDGSSLGLRATILRYLVFVACIATVIPGLISAFMARSNPRRQMWWDRVGGSAVVCTVQSADRSPQMQALGSGTVSLQFGLLQASPGRFSILQNSRWLIPGNTTPHLLRIQRGLFGRLRISIDGQVQASLRRMGWGSVTRTSDPMTVDGHQVVVFGQYFLVPKALLGILNGATYYFDVFVDGRSMLDGSDIGVLAGRVAASEQSPAAQLYRRQMSPGGMAPVITVGEAVALMHEPGFLAGWAVLIVGNVLVLQVGARGWRWVAGAASPSLRTWLRALVVAVCIVGLVAVMLAGAAAAQRL